MNDADWYKWCWLVWMMLIGMKFWEIWGRIQISYIDELISSTNKNAVWNFSDQCYRKMNCFVCWKNNRPTIKCDIRGLFDQKYEREIESFKCKNDGSRQKSWYEVGEMDPYAEKMIPPTIKAASMEYFNQAYEKNVGISSAVWRCRKDLSWAELENHLLNRGAALVSINDQRCWLPSSMIKGADRKLLHIGDSIS